MSSEEHKIEEYHYEEYFLVNNMLDTLDDFYLKMS